MPHKMELWLQGLKQGRTMRFRPLGGSMNPSLRLGNIVTIVPGNNARIGDVVLTHTTAGLILHRVVWKGAGRIITKGDSLTHLDPPVTPEALLGRAVSRDHRGKKSSLVSFYSRFCGLGLSLTLPWVIKYFPAIVALKRLFPRRLRSGSQYS
jgi:hypothetical protein